MTALFGKRHPGKFTISGNSRKEIWFSNHYPTIFTGYCNHHMQRTPEYYTTDAVLLTGRMCCCCCMPQAY